MVKKGSFSHIAFLHFLQDGCPAGGPGTPRPTPFPSPLRLWADNQIFIIRSVCSCRMFPAHTSEFRNRTRLQPVTAVTLEEWLLSPFCGSDDSSGNWAERLISSVFVDSIFIRTWAFDFWDVKHTVPLSREFSWTIKDVRFSSNRSFRGDHTHRWSWTSVVPSHSSPCRGGSAVHEAASF